MSLTVFLSTYSYWAILVGCLLEGETVLLLAGFAAHQGWLSLPHVIAVAFLAGSLGDTSFFLVGKFFGARLLARLPRLASRVEQVNRLLLRYQRGIIVAVRFMYGLRIAGPIILGNSGVPIRRFMLFNLLGAALWATLVASCGYVFGQTAQWLLTDVGHYQWIVMLVLVLLLWGWHGWRQHVRRQQAKH